MEAMDGKNWRKELYPEYKAQRPKNSDIFDYLNYIFETFIPEYSMKHPNVSISRRTGTEADDLIAERVFDILKNTNEDICIIASDMDYLQLVSKGGRVSICDMNLKVLSNKELIGHEYLIKKIIYGDSSDNIKPIYKGRQSGVKKQNLLEKCIEIYNLDNVTRNLFESDETFEIFKLNRKLIEFSCK